MLAQWARKLSGLDYDVAWIAGDSLGRLPEILQSVVDANAERLRRGLASRTVVIIDDLQVIPVGRSNAISSALIDALPSVAGLIVAGRHQPFGSLVSLQVSASVAELRTSDLAFTRAELDELTTSHGYVLDDVVGDLLLHRTGGWAIALALATPWLKGKEDPLAAVTSFADDHRAVGDYLVTEVLESLSGEESYVLSKSAIRRDVPVELASYLTGLPNAGDLLHEIAQQNSLMIEESGVFYYHPVLLNFLQADTRRKDSNDYAHAHVLAFEWFAEREDGANAMQEAVSSAHATTIQEAIELFGLELMLTGEMDLVSRAMAALPGRSGSLVFLAADLLLEAPFFADTMKARHLLVDALKYDETGTPASEPWLAAVCALHCLTSKDQPQYESRLARLRMEDIVSLRRGSLALDLLVAMAEACCIGALGSPGEALRMLSEVAIGADRAGFTWLSLMAATYAAPLASLSGRWDLAAAIDDQVIAQVSKDPGSLVGRVRSTATIITVAQAYRRCTTVATEELDALIAANAHDMTRGAYVPAVLARSYAALDADANPRPTLELVSRLLRDHGPQYKSMFAATAVSMVSLHLRLDGRAEAQQCAEDFYAVIGRDCVEARTVRLALALPTRSGDSAEEALLSALCSSEGTWHSGAASSAWILLAHSAELQGRHSEADIRLGAALKLAHRFETEHSFAVRGGEGATLLESRVGRFGHLDGFAAQVIASVRSMIPNRMPGAGVTDTLTRREHEILKELPVHQSVAEIARKLTLSVNTVKTHLRSIYQKLNVSDRSEAVAAAHARGLL